MLRGLRGRRRRHDECCSILFHPAPHKAGDDYPPLRSFCCAPPILGVGPDLPIRTGAIRVSANTSILGKLTGAEGI